VMSEYQFLKEGPVRELSDDEIVAFLEVFKKLAKNKRNEWKKELHPEFKKQIAKWNDENKERKAENKKVMEQDQEEEAEEVQVDVLSDEDIIKVIKACRDGRDFIELQSERAEVLEYCKEHGINSENFGDVEEAEEPKKKRKEVNDKQNRFNTRTFSVLNSKDEQKDWIIEDLLKERSIHLYAGEESSFKTGLVIASCLIASQEKTVLGKKVSRPYKMLLLDKENGESDTALTINQIMKGMGIKKKNVEKCFFVDTLTKFNFTDEWIQLLRDEIIRGKYDVVVFDNLSCMADGINDMTDISKIHGMLKPLTEELNVSFIVIAHPRKGRGDRPDEIAGSRYLRGMSDVVLIFKHHNEKRKADPTQVFSIKHHRTKKGLGIDDIYYEVVGAECCPLTIQLKKTDDGITALEGEKQIWKWMKQTGEFKTKDMLKAFSYGRTHLYKICTKHINKGYLELISKGHYKITNKGMFTDEN